MRRPSSSLLSRDEYFDRWAELHGGHDPRSSRMTSVWLGAMYRLARPVAATGVPPDAVTLAGAVVSGAAVAAAGQGGRWVLVAAVLVAVSGAMDNLDGAVAVMTQRTTRWGYVLDSLVDRVSDALYLVALWLVGAPAAVCVAAGVLMGLQEYTRARAGQAGMPGIGVVTLWERPTRVIATAMFLLGAGLYLDDAAGWATAGAVAWAALGVVGVVQIVVVVRRRLTADEEPDHPEQPA